MSTTLNSATLFSRTPVRFFLSLVPVGSVTLSALPIQRRLWLSSLGEKPCETPRLQPRPTLDSTRLDVNASSLTLPHLADSPFPQLAIFTSHPLPWSRLLSQLHIAIITAVVLPTSIVAPVTPTQTRTSPLAHAHLTVCDRCIPEQSRNISCT